jgi:hypothetical protein
MTLLDRLKQILAPDVIFPDGSRIKPLHRMALRYFEDEKTLDIGYEPISCWFSYELIVSSLKNWNPPYDSVEINQDMKRAIIEKVLLYGRKRGHKVKIRNDVFDNK